MFLQKHLSSRDWPGTRRWDVGPGDGGRVPGPRSRRASSQCKCISERKETPRAWEHWAEEIVKHTSDWRVGVGGENSGCRGQLRAAGPAARLCAVLARRPCCASSVTAPALSPVSYRLSSHIGTSCDTLETLFLASAEDRRSNGAAVC